MKKKKIVTIVGARPQFIKMAPVSRELRQEFDEIVINTGQHYDYKMSGVFFEELNIPKPDYDLEVGSSSHGKQTGAMLEGIENILIKEKPDAVLVYGDTNSTLAGAVAASKLHFPVLHIEAGLRSFNKKMPEEINRILTDHVSTLLFAPTTTAVNNLENEGIVTGVYNVGDVMFDAVLNGLDIVEKQLSLEYFGVEEKGYYLATIHRAENTDNKKIVEAIFQELSKLNKQVLLPLHPRTRNKIKDFNLEHLLEVENIKLIEPVTYLEMLLLEKNAAKIVTDSGGVQKEAYFMGIPCYTLRTETEWVETVQVGWNHLINPESESIASIINSDFVSSERPNIFGIGTSAKTIKELLQRFL